MDWNSLTKEELVHLLEDDKEAEALIVVHLAANIRGQRALHTKCYTCDTVARKLGLVVEGSTMTKLDSLRLIRWLLNCLADPDDSLSRAQTLLSQYEARR